MLVMRDIELNPLYHLKSDMHQIACLTAGDKLIVIHGGLDAVEVRRADSGVLVADASVRDGEPVKCAVVSADGRRVYVGTTHGTVTALNVESGDMCERLWSSVVFSIPVSAICLSSDGKHLATVAMQFGKGPTKLSVWAIDEKGLLRVDAFRTIAEDVTCVAFSGDDNLVIGMEGGTLGDAKSRIGNR